MRNFSVRGVLLAVLVLGVGALGIGPVSAHAALAGSDPKDGASFETAPTTLTFTFNENVGNAFVAVTAPDGSKVKVGKVDAINATVTATVTDVGQKGQYTGSYRVVSADGHPVSGTVTYQVTTGRAVTQVEQAKSETFIHRHSSHLIWGILAAIVAIGLLLFPLWRRGDADA